MRFGGHETFAIREGWLHKGLKLLHEAPDRMHAPDCADWLGVGRNMGKSIKHWLLATGLASQAEGHGRDISLKVSALGELVLERDPYFLQAGTWWALHIELANCQDHAVTWWWFFNQFSLTRFDRAVCLTNLRAHLELSQPRVPAQKTLQRDIACLIASYATPIPAESVDPEDADDCPLRELRLMTYSRSTGACSLNTALKPVPPELLGYAVARAPFLSSGGQGSCDVTLREAASRDGGPGKAFVMGADALFELALRAEHDLGRSSLVVAGLGAERTIRIERREKASSWLEAYYDRILERRHAA
jgi:hypothetical protein